jgi:hypothetical protein
MTGFSYRWEFFNHRLSFLDVGVDESAPRAAVVGGTSTSGLDPDLPAGCDPAGCDELPFIDLVDVQLGWGHVIGSDASFAVAIAEMSADEDGEQVTVTAPLENTGGPLSAVIRGLKISTDRALDDGDGCYLPRNGWLPTALGIQLDEPVLADGEASVVVHANFAAGNTLEEMRTCIDEVIGRARVDVSVDVLFVHGGGAAAEAAIESAATFPLHDPADASTDPPVAEQTLPAGTAPSLGLIDPLVGWRAMSWQFHADDPDGRGAYLRSLNLVGSSETAMGGATSYSPGTQLSDFAYAFEGTLVGHEVGGAVSTGTLEVELEVLTDEAGAAMTQMLDSPW